MLCDINVVFVRLMNAGTSLRKNEQQSDGRTLLDLRSSYLQVGPLRVSRANRYEYGIEESKLQKYGQLIVRSTYFTVRISSKVNYILYRLARFNPVHENYYCVKNVGSRSSRLPGLLNNYS